MSATVIGKQFFWELERDEDGHRNYKVKHKVETTVVGDGPAIVLTASGLPAIGDSWSFDNDSDTTAFCYPNAIIKPVRQEEINVLWTVEQKFSTRPINRCQDTDVGDPLLEPQKISGSFVKYTEEAIFDRFNNLIQSSSHELFKGPETEFDANRPTVRIEQNVSSLELNLFTPMIDTVNDAILWGVGRRMIKLSQLSWEEKFQGVCDNYFTRIMEFDINRNTFDRRILDEGTKILNGVFNRVTGVYEVKDVAPNVPADPLNPEHFIRYKDKNGENSRVILNGAGLPASVSTTTGTGTGTTDTGGPALLSLQKYTESNFLLLGIPTDLGTL